MKDFNDLKILIAGEGGQGVQTIAKILLKAGYEKGFKVSYIPNYGVEQRGGVSIAFLLIQKKPVIYPKFQKGDIVVILSERSLYRCWRYIDKETILIYNSSYISKKVCYLQKPRTKNLIPIDADNLANNKLKEPRAFNMIVLGALLSKLPITLGEMKKTLKKVLGYKYKKNPKLEEKNNQALELGYKLTQ